MIYTGYFDKIEEYKKKCLIPVSIAGRAPDWYDGIECRKLAPKLSWWQKWHDEHLSNAWYINQYHQTVLSKFSAKEVFEDLKKFGENVVLLCYEKPGQFCHRNIVATWFKENGINVEEYKIEKEKGMIKDKIKQFLNNQETDPKEVSNEWKKEPYKEYIFSAKHVETGLHLYIEDDGRIKSSNWTDWARHMGVDEKLSVREVVLLQEGLTKEFIVWAHMEDERLTKEEIAAYEKAVKQAQKEANLYNKMFPYMLEQSMKGRKN